MLLPEAEFIELLAKRAILAYTQAHTDALTAFMLDVQAAKVTPDVFQKVLDATAEVTLKSQLLALFRAIQRNEPIRVPSDKIRDAMLAVEAKFEAHIAARRRLELENGHCGHPGASEGAGQDSATGPG